jgi:lambda repressor-like predicted transcriptional regulator
MIKKLGIVLGSAVVVGLVGLLVANAAFAQGTTPTATATPQASTPQGKSSLQWRTAGGPNAGMDEIAKLLNMTPDQIWAERVLGKTIADLAKEKGVSDQQLIDALVANQKTVLDQAVTDGRLTQAQADKWLEWYKQVAALQLTEPYAGGFGGMSGGFGMPRVRGAGPMPGRGPGGQPGNAAPQPPTTTQ